GEKIAEDFLKNYAIQKSDLKIVIHPGARQEYIRWKKEGFAKVSDELIKQYNAKIILIGSSNESNLVGEIASLMKQRPILAIGLKLTVLVSLIKRCHLFIGNSTGPMHLAAALKVPVVAIFGNIHPLDSYQEWGPWGENHIVVSKNLRCKNCHPGDCRTLDCMRLITAEDVLDAAKKQIDRQKW
ncbi:MAG: glycosyltransferase family 9 protein, partial [Candidatus Omnitrophica bacterium]|nr:glycosyltransferase family 9 protein [Candidatus Omnitrophota bacterium]